MPAVEPQPGHSAGLRDGSRQLTEDVAGNKIKVARFHTTAADGD